MERFECEDLAFVLTDLGFLEPGAKISEDETVREIIDRRNRRLEEIGECP